MHQHLINRSMIDQVPTTPPPAITSHYTCDGVSEICESETESILANLKLLKNLHLPELSVSILVHNEGAPQFIENPDVREFKQGDTIKGIATICSKTDLNFEMIYVYLVGTSTVVKWLGEYTSRDFLKMVDLESILTTDDTRVDKMGFRTTLPSNHTLEAGVVYKLPFHFQLPWSLIDVTCERQLSDHLDLPPSLGINRESSGFLGNIPDAGFACHKNLYNKTVGGLKGGDGIFVNDLSSSNHSISYCIKAVVVGRGNSIFSTNSSREPAGDFQDNQTPYENLRSLLPYSRDSFADMEPTHSEDSGYAIANEATFQLRVVPTLPLCKGEEKVGQSLEQLRKAFATEFKRLTIAIEARQSLLLLNSLGKDLNPHHHQNLDPKNFVKGKQLFDTKVSLDLKHQFHGTKHREKSLSASSNIKYRDVEWSIPYRSPLRRKREYRGWRKKPPDLPVTQRLVLEVDHGQGRALKVKSVELESFTLDSKEDIPFILDCSLFADGLSEEFFNEFRTYRARWTKLNKLYDSLKHAGDIGLEEYKMDKYLVKSLMSVLNMSIKRDSVCKLPIAGVDATPSSITVSIDIGQRTKQTLVPTFQSCLIARFYTLKLELEMDKKKSHVSIPIQLTNLDGRSVDSPKF